MIVDFCAYLGEWPTYELPHRTPDGLLALMKRCGIGAACVSLAGGMFYFDAGAANERLAQLVGEHRARLWPIGALDPTIPTWRADLQEGLERYGMAGFRLHANYQDYSLTEPAVIECAHALAEVNCPLFIAMYVDEERFQHPAIRVPNVPLLEIEELIRRAPETTLVLNGLKVEHALPLFERRLESTLFYLDINAMDMPFDGLTSLVAAHGANRLLFASQMPFLYPEAALMVLEYSDLSPADINAIAEQNWELSPVLAQLGTRTAFRPH